MNAMTNNMPAMGNSNNMMDSLKSNMMTMLMINTMNGSGGGSGNGSGKSQDMFSMIYVFVATSVVDFVFKNAPSVFNFFMRKYTDKIETIKKDMSNTTKDITDNKIKKKTASITVTINVNSADSILGQALLDFITNNKNTTHVSYVRESFILNQKDVINIDDDVFARMTQSTSADQSTGQGSTSTNTNTGSGVSGSSAIVQVIEVYSFTKTTDELRNFLDDIRQKYAINVKNKLGNKRYYFNMHPLNVPMDIDKRKDLSRLPPNFAFVMKHFQTNRKFSNLFGEDIDIIRNRVDFFTKNRKWYNEKGIPYTLGLLLSGSPGTGKTSTIKCLANETNRHICNINLNNDMTKTQLENLFFNENINVLNPMSGQNESYCIPLDQRIYVLEDVDCQSDMVMERSLKNDQKKNQNNDKDQVPNTLPRTVNTRTDESVDRTVQEHYEDKHKVDLSFLLNLLDGVLENPGRIVIMTSNFPDTLDSALIRPGRIDVIAKFRNCTNKTVTEMIEFFYDIVLSDDDKKRISCLKEEIITPAELSKVMFENFSDFEASIVHMENLSHKNILLLAEEESRKAKLLAEEESRKAKMLAESETAYDNLISDMLKNPYPPSYVNSIPNPEESFEEKGGELSTELNSNNQELAIHIEATNYSRNERIKIDILYVFKKNVLIQFAPKENIIKFPDEYYQEKLLKYVFKTKLYSTFANELITEYFDIIDSIHTLQDCFDNRVVSNISIHCTYRSSIIAFFSARIMHSTGLQTHLELDGLIDKGYGSILTSNIEKDVGSFMTSPTTLLSSTSTFGSSSVGFSTY